MTLDEIRKLAEQAVRERTTLEYCGCGYTVAIAECLLAAGPVIEAAKKYTDASTWTDAHEKGNLVCVAVTAFRARIEKL